MITFSVNNELNVDSIVREISLAAFYPKTYLGRYWLSDIFFKALEGKIDKDTNPDAYGYVCEQESIKAKDKNESPILREDEIGDGKKGVLADIVVSTEADINSSIDAMNIKSVAEEFIDMHDYLFVEEGVSLWRIVQKVKKHNARAIDKLRYLIAEYNMEELIKEVLGKRECYELIVNEIM